MRNIRKILKDNNLSPRENILTLLKNYAHENVTGKNILKDSEIQSLIKSFRPKNSYEQEQYFKYKDMWENFRDLEKDMYVYFLSIQVDLLSFKDIVTMFNYEDLDKLKKDIGYKNQGEESPCLKYLLENSWLDYNETIKKYQPLIVKKMIDGGELKVKNLTEKFLHHKHTTKIITGSSLYYADDRISFVKDYIEQVDKLIPYAFLFYSLKEQNFEKKLGIFLSFQKIAKKVSGIIGAEASRLPTDIIRELRNIVDDINVWLQSIEVKIENFVWENDNNFKIHTSFERKRIDLLSVKKETNKTLEIVNEKMIRLLRDEWGFEKKNNFKKLFF